MLGHDFSIIGLDGTKRLLAHAAGVAAEDADRRLRPRRAARARADRTTRSARPRARSSSTRRTAGAARRLLSAQVAGLRARDHDQLPRRSCSPRARSRPSATRTRSAGSLRGLVGLGRLIVAEDRARGDGRRSGSASRSSLGFGIAVEAGNVSGRRALAAAAARPRWASLLAGAAVGAVGDAHRRARAGVASGLARRVLVVLPVVFLGLVPREIVPAAAWISDAFPFAHAVRFFASALYDRSPWETVVARGRLAGRARRGVLCAGAGLGAAPGCLDSSGCERVPGHPAAAACAAPARSARSCARRGSTSTTSSCRSSSGRRRSRTRRCRRSAAGRVDDVVARGRGARRGSGVQRGDPVRHPRREGRRGLRRVGRRRHRPARAARAARRASPSCCCSPTSASASTRRTATAASCDGDEVDNDATLDLLARTAVCARRGRRRRRLPERHDGRPRRRDPRGAAGDADRRLLGEVRLGVLRAVPRGGRLGAVVRRPARLPDGSRPTSARRCASASSTSPRAPT